MIRTLLTTLPAGSGGKIAAHLTLTVVSVALRAAGTVLLVPFVAALFGGEPMSAWPWVAALTCATVLGWVVDASISRFAFDLGFGMLDSAQKRVADRISRTRLAWFTADNTATARQAIASTGPDLIGLLVYLVTPLLAALLLPVAIAAALLPISLPLAVAALAGVPVLLGAFWASGRLGAAADRASAASNSSLTERIVEFARTQQALRAARRVDPARSHAGAALDAQHASTMRLLLMQVPGQLLFSLANQLALVALAGVTVWLTVTGELSVPEAIALIVVIVRYLEPFTSLSELTPGIENARGPLSRIRTVLEAPAPAFGATVREALAPPALELRDVHFRYSDDGPTQLEALSLRLQPGTTTAIVGPSGSGKSTVLALLAGLREPTGGSVLVDGVDASEFSEDARHDLVSFVFQHPYLFDGSMRENILAGHPGATEGELAAAASLAQLDELTTSTPGGLDARVGEAGTGLSGGERQRVSIARALLKPAPVLLVDEATSALDTENEQAIVEALTADPTPRTRVIVAHRLASIRTADRVVVLEDGRIVEDGTVDGLLAAGGRFAEFWRQQDAASGWRIGA